MGSRGRDGFRRALLGSASHRCAVHATCPVLIVRPETEAPEGEDGALIGGRVAPLSGLGPRSCHRDRHP
ncbi:universal stress protein [Streptomyces sp. HNM0645]|uniref:universal stress protein n=1 Tax=Streptomyces sp. HNM0645 TaxID=2782343 RepID=UPI0032D5700F